MIYVIMSACIPIVYVKVIDGVAVKYQYLLRVLSNFRACNIYFYTAIKIYYEVNSDKMISRTTKMDFDKEIT